MQITIIGGGIAGLSAYIFLSRHLEVSESGPHDIRIIEVYRAQQDAGNSYRDRESTESYLDEMKSASSVIGAAIGIGKNGLAVLERIDDGDVLKLVKERGNCISKWEIGTARGWKLVDANVTSSSGKGEDKEPQPTVMIARQVMWEILRDKVLTIDSGAIVTAKVVEIQSAQDGKVTLLLEDGNRCVTDLVIGADGLRSMVRKKMFEHTKDVEPQSCWETLTGKEKRIKDYMTPHFEGLTGLGGMIPACVLKNAGFEHGTMAITFGPNGFFGHGHLSPPEDQKLGGMSSTRHEPPLAGWWSTFSSSTPYPCKETDKSKDVSPGTKRTTNNDAILHDLRIRHGSWKDPVIQAILNYICKDNDTVLSTYPTFTTPELPTWHKDNLVLIGDAAHALQPSSGQGACQALEDSEALALLLSRYLDLPNTTQKAAITGTLKKFDELRMPRLAKIYAQSSKFAKTKTDMNIVQEFLMYFFIWLMHKVGAFQKYNDELFEYDLPAEVDRVMGK